MNLEPRVEVITDRKLIGKKMLMSLSNNKTGELWRSFMPRRREIKGSIGSMLYSMQVYNPGYFDNFNPTIDFEKWAAIEVTDFDAIPPNMEAFTLPAGLYAVFLYKGAASAATATFQYIFETWLPTSDYSLSNRPHFELLGERYKHEDVASEEEIWVPVEKKK